MIASTNCATDLTEQCLKRRELFLFLIFYFIVGQPEVSKISCILALMQFGVFSFLFPMQCSLTYGG